MSASPSRARLTSGQLVLIVVLLAAQFLLRTYQPLKQPAFVDENYHVRRGEIAYDFDRNPVEFSNGKLLFYYWLGLFAPHGDSALAVGRLAVALFSLITSAAIMALARALFGRAAMVPALALYALAPYAVFFERMALADPFAGGLAALTAWQSVRLARAESPSRACGALVGLLVAVTTFAKLTTAPIAALPLAAGIFYSDVTLPPRNRTAIKHWAGLLWRRYRRAWIPAALVIVMLWGLFLAGMAAYKLSGEQPKFFTQHLVDEPGASSVADNIEDTIDAASDYLSAPVVITLFLFTLLLLWQHPASGRFLLVWLLALWLPTTIFGSPVQTRYLMAGIPALAVIFGGGMVTLSRLSNRRVIDGLLAALLIAWAALYAMPFGWRAMTDPASLPLPRNDTYSYLSGPYAGWGTREALTFLRENGERIPVTSDDGDVSEQIPAVGVLQHCGSISLHVTDDFMWTCVDAKNFPIGAIPADVREWSPLLEALETWPFVYLVTEFAGSDTEDLAQTWELVYASSRPLGGWTVAVWRITPSD